MSFGAQFCELDKGYNFLEMEELIGGKHLEYTLLYVVTKTLCLF